MTDSRSKKVITALYDTKPGEVWTQEHIRAMREVMADAGMHVTILHMCTI